MKLNKRIIVILFFLRLMISPLEMYGDGKDRVVDNIKYFKSTAIFKYLINYPAQFSNEKSYNLIIALHGGGGSPERFSEELKLLSAENVLIVPQGPYPWLVGDKLAYDWALWPSKDESAISRASLISEDYLKDLIIKCKALYKVKKIYLLGFSQGAIFAYRAGIKNPDIVDGIISLSGPGLLKNLKSPFMGELISDWLPEQYIKKGNKLRVFIANGKKDKSTTIELGIRSRDVLINCGYDVTFMIFNGGHEIKPEVLVAVQKWLGI